MAVIDNLTLELNADSTKAVKAIEALSRSLATLKTSIPTGNSLNKTADGLKNLAESISKISLSNRSLEKIKALGDIGKSLTKIKEGSMTEKKLEGTANGLSLLGASLDSLSYEGINKIERLANAMSKMPTYGSAKKAISSAIKTSNVATTKDVMQEGGETETASTSNIRESFSLFENFWTKFQTVSTMAKTNPISLLASSENAQGMANLAEKSGIAVGTLTKLSKVLGWVGIVLSAVSIGIKVVKKAFDILLTPIKKAINAVLQFGRALARIAFYRFVRSIIKGISQGITEGIQNLAKYSKAMEELDTHSANHVMSRYASEFLYFKNAIATAVIPVLRAMIPLIETVINKCIDFINVIAQIGSAFFGTTFTKAKYFWVDYADSLDNANGRAKALHHQLAGFDELNNLTAPSGGSGSADLLDPSKMFEEANISEEILGKVNKIKEVLEKVKKLGKDILTILSPIGDKGKEIADWFSRLWERVEPNVKKVWELVEKIWNKLAEPLGEGFVKGFVDEFFSAFSDEDKIEKIGKFSDKIGKLADAISKLLDKLDSEKVKRFGEILGRIAGITLRDLPANILALVFPLFNVVLQFKRFNDTAKDNADLVQKVADKLALLDEKTKEILEPLKKLCIDLKDIIWEIGDAITFTIENFLKIGEVEMAWLYFSTKIKKIFEDIKNTIGGDLDAIKDKVLNLFKDIPILGKIAEYFSDSQSGAGGFLRTGLGNNKIKMQGYATGGFVDNGDLFIANERGAEMVGSIGNQTAVANNDQITQAIATATYNAMSKALSENNGSVTFVVEGDGDQMYKIWQKKNREYERRTGYAF